MTDDMRRMADALLGSEWKAAIAVFFHRNPGVVETVEGLARRLGTRPEQLEDAVRDHVEAGLLRPRTLGGQTLLQYDRQRRAELGSMIEDAARQAMEDA